MRLESIRGNWLTTFILAVGIVAAAISRNIMFGCIVMVMAAMGTGLNVDNALVLVPLLRRMPPVVRALFLIAGIAVSVAFVQLYLPTLLVAIVAHIPPSQSLHMAFFESEKFSQLLESTTSQYIAAGAGGFLLMAGLQELTDPHKETHWLPFEKYLVSMSQKWQLFGTALPGAAMLFLGMFAPTPARATFLMVCFGTHVVFMFFTATGNALKSEDNASAEPASYV